MSKSKNVKVAPVLALLVVLMVASACSDDQQTDGAAPAPDQDSASSISAPAARLAATTTPPATTTLPATTTTPATTTSSTTTTLALPPVPTAGQCIATAPTTMLVGQIVVATITQGGIVELTPEVVAGELGGIVLLGVADADVGEAIGPLYQAAIPPIVGVDEEGGVVQRLGSVLGRDPSARQHGDRGNLDTTFFTGAKRATGAANLGFNMVFAPVLDLGRSAGIRSRSYGDSPEVVSSFAMAYADGLIAGGVIPVAKHFPGHGSTGLDSHLRLPVTSPLDELRAADLIPFEVASDGLGAIMIGHLDVPGLTEGLPASLSAAAIDLLRDDLGFEGLVVSDDLSMGALQRWTVAEAAELALIAGEDLLIAGGLSESLGAVDGLISAVEEGRITRARLEDAALRVLAVKGVDPCGQWPV